MNLQELVKNFIVKPYPLSALVIDGHQHHYYNYLALFHIVLVAKNKKKGFVIPEVRNGIKICKKIKLHYKIVSGFLPIMASKNNKIPENTTKEIINLFHNLKYAKHLVCSNDSTYDPDNRIVEDVEEYPTCCIDSFNENKWNDLTIAENQATEENLDKSDKYYVEMIIAGSEEAYLNETMYNHTKSIMHEYAETREKYPFVFYQACSKCLADSNSPSAKLNSTYSMLCQKEFPDLYQKIIEGAQLDAKTKISRWSKTWSEIQYEMLKGQFKNSS